jgi:hypothetical protein
MRYIFPIILLSILITGCGVGLVLTIQYSYLDDIFHYHIATCHYFNCTGQIGNCCGAGGCHDCYHVNLVLNLTINNETYFRKVDTRFDLIEECNYRWKTLKCYYDDRNIEETLGFTCGPPMAVIGVILLSMFLAVLFFCFLGYCCACTFTSFDKLILDD